MEVADREMADITMTTDEFIAKTQAVIAKEGFDSYLPTLIIETRRTIRIAVLEDELPEEAA